MNYKLMLFSMIFLLIPFVSAEYSEISIYDELSFDNILKETISITLENNNESIFSIALPKDAYNIKVNDKTKELNDGFLDLNMSCKSCIFNVSYEIAGKIEIANLFDRTYSRTLDFPESPKTLNYKILIPSGYLIGHQTESSEPIIVPKPTKISTNGKDILIRWTQEEPEFPIRYFIMYHLPKEKYAFFEGVNEELHEPVVWLFIIISAIIFFVAGYFVHKFKSKKENAIISIPSFVLTPDEITILDIIKKHDEINQKIIGTELSWSKSKVSAILTNLEYKKIIHKEKQGRNFKVKLIKKID